MLKSLLAVAITLSLLASAAMADSTSRFTNNPDGSWTHSYHGEHGYNDETTCSGPLGDMSCNSKQYYSAPAVTVVPFNARDEARKAEARQRSGYHDPVSIPLGGPR